MMKRFYNYLGMINRGNVFVRLSHKTNQQPKEKPAQKLAQDVVNYLESLPEYKDIIEKVPKSLLKKYKTPESMYLVNKKTAKEIVNTISEHLNSKAPIIEVNPGFGYLSEELLKCQKQHIYMYEVSQNFSAYLNNIIEQYPGRVVYKMADFFGMWKLAFKDKLDQGKRIEELLGDLCTQNKDREVIIIGSMPGLSFVKHLINNIIFHNSTNQLGKPNLYITMPGSDYEIMTSLPRGHFLPWTYKSELKKITLMDEHRLYLVNITQKDTLPCPSEYLPLLWYFFKPHTFSKTTRVIPMLEQWIPGCGVWLITGQDPPDTNTNLAPGANDAALPHMTIFTEFGDLTLKQKITVFKKFISWPEFEQCQFRVTMENNLPKFITQLDNDKDSITHMEDIEEPEGHTDTEHDP